MELILGGSSYVLPMKQNGTSKHFVSVYASFHPGCKNICEFLWRGLSYTSSCRFFLLSFILLSSHKTASGFLPLGFFILASTFLSWSNCKLECNKYIHLLIIYIIWRKTIFDSKNSNLHIWYIHLFVKNVGCYLNDDDNLPINLTACLCF